MAIVLALTRTVPRYILMTAIAAKGVLIDRFFKGKVVMSLKYSLSRVTLRSGYLSSIPGYFLSTVASLRVSLLPLGMNVLSSILCKSHFLFETGRI